MKKRIFALCLLLIPFSGFGQSRLDKDGTLVVNDQRRFILGTYHNPGELSGLLELAQNGINLVRCGADAMSLDQARTAGLFAWVNTGANLDLSENPAERKQNLLAMAAALKDHPALVVWEAPDEALWNLYYPNLEKQLHRSDLTEARLDSLLKDLEQNSRRLADGFQKGLAVLRQGNPHRPVWFNHAPRNSIEQLKPFSSLADIIGCDIYPVRVGHNGHSDLIDKDLSCVGAYTDRMQASGPNKPVWMVLQAFSWEQLTSKKPEEMDPQGFPSFNESRFMAYEAILHGARGLLWWGSTLSSTKAAFCKAILAVTSELAELEPYLVAPELKKQLTVEPLTFAASEPSRVAYSFRRHQNDYLLILSTEDNGQWVRVDGLQRLNGRAFYDVAGGRRHMVQQGRLLLSPQSRLSVLCTDRQWELVQPNPFPAAWDRFSRHPLKEIEDNRR
ncbi:MAG TPA: hypothetical protein PK843_08140 [bacterium]|nr:hypothetical protein [bacterium]HPN34468.1 hypothetical protein [bacterium]